MRRMSRFANVALVHSEIEQKLERRIPSALSPRPRTIRERLVSDVPGLDAALGAGLPVGAITELVGVTGSGRTTAAAAFVAMTARIGRMAAWIDVSDAFDPISAGIYGVDLRRLLWVRCGSPEPDVPVSANTTPTQATVSADAPIPVRGGGSPHPRTEINGMPEAIRSILTAHGGFQGHQSRRERKMIGTPGAPNRPLGCSPYREEQVPSDRSPSRQAARRASEIAAAPRCAEPQPHRRKTIEMRQAASGAPVRAAALEKQTVPKKNPWSALDQALRTTDLLLQAGGFGLIVLDLGDTPADKAWRVPLATWFRYRAGCEHSRTSLLLLTQHPCARSSAELVVRFEPGQMVGDNSVISGFDFQCQVERQRFAAQPENVVPIRKPPQSEKPGRWNGSASWAV